MARIFLYIMLLMGGLLVAGATGDLVAAGRYDLLFGPSELAQSVSSLGDRVDDKMALQSALTREYGVTNIGQAIRLLEERYNAENPVIIPINLSINIPINSHKPLDGAVAGGRVMKYLYAQVFNVMMGESTISLHQFILLMGGEKQLQSSSP